MIVKRKGLKQRSIKVRLEEGIVRECLTIGLSNMVKKAGLIERIGESQAKTEEVTENIE